MSSEELNAVLKMIGSCFTAKLGNLGVVGSLDKKIDLP
jgi:hypothetical protein